VHADGFYRVVLPQGIEVVAEGCIGCIDIPPGEAKVFVVVPDLMAEVADLFNDTGIEASLHYAEVVGSADAEAVFQEGGLQGVVRAEVNIMAEGDDLSGEAERQFFQGAEGIVLRQEGGEEGAVGG